MRRASDDFERAGELVQKEVAGAAAILSPPVVDCAI
jgi:hypothetical protein